MTLGHTILILALAQGSFSSCKTRTTLPDKPKEVAMVLVKGQTFAMGSDSEAIQTLATRYHLPYDYLSPEVPVHKVRLSSFYIDKYEVTNAAYKVFIEANPEWKKENINPSLSNGNYLKSWVNSNYPVGEENFPVCNVPWFAAMAYAKWAGKRLPSEAEWELAAKNGTGENIDFPWGNDLPDSLKANYGKSNIGHAIAVGHYKPNALGLFDLAGNVWEYCLDAWDDKFYQHCPLTNPVAGKDSLTNYLIIKTRRVIRGGSWGGSAINLRTTFRDSHPVNGAGDHVGFRCVKDVE